MRPVVLWYDVEEWTCTHLRAQLAARPEPWTVGVYVSNMIPEPREPRMVIVNRDGGPRLTVASELARLRFRVFGTTKGEAADLANMVRSLMFASLGEGPVRKVSEALGPTEVADPSEQPMRLLSIEVTARAAA